jgi:hypothetical protein
MKTSTPWSSSPWMSFEKYVSLSTIRTSTSRPVASVNSPT